MKITGIDAITWTQHPHMLWIHVHTDAGIVGLGETMFGAGSVAAAIRENVAPYLIGQDPLAIDRHSRRLMLDFPGFASHGAEMRAASAVDMALWDIFGKLTGQPVYQLLGGASRMRVRAYNTCAGYSYYQRPAVEKNDNWGLRAASSGPYDDLRAFLERPGELAADLLSEGFSAMKIWPFDLYAPASDGHYLSPTDLVSGTRVFEQIRKAVGMKIDVMLEMHSLWSLPSAQQIARAVEPMNPFWFEDPIKMNDLDGLREFARSTRVPVTASETLATRWSFRTLLAERAASYVMFDLGWCGGISEAKKIAAMAEAHSLPVAPHDCTGPVVWTAACHLTTNVPNAVFQECVRAYYTGWYKEVVTELPAVSDGYVTAPAGPGLGTALQQSFLQRPDVKAVNLAVN
ncbi:MAG TPA: mandelate racemase/muconate lactonizing enzyme family protein [Bauldia sp.]|nr:mandelate racemase/muconate lactonizing enzyme family protein [Bauldia sp.]